MPFSLVTFLHGGKKVTPIEKLKFDPQLLHKKLWGKMSENSLTNPRF